MSKFYDFEAEDVMCNMHKMEEYQAPGTNEEIVSFCDAKFGITFKHYAKIDVNGADIKWNFTKFLIDREGNVVERFEPTTDMDVVEEKIREIL